MSILTDSNKEVESRPCVLPTASAHELSVHFFPFRGNFGPKIARNSSFSTTRMICRLYFAAFSSVSETWIIRIAGLRPIIHAGNKPLNISLFAWPRAASSSRLSFSIAARSQSR